MVLHLKRPTDMRHTGAISGQIVRGTIRNATGADWEFFPALECAVAAVDPNDKDHFL